MPIRNTMRGVWANSFPEVQQYLTRMIIDSADKVVTERWQGRDVAKDPSAATYELRNVNFEVPMGAVEDLDHWRQEIKPNLPWADDHFAERVCGEPLNPGVQWAHWPWATSADTFRKNDQFNHSYMERLWPKWARQSDGGECRITVPDRIRKHPHVAQTACHVGHAWQYGDLEDVVDLLAHEPHTRQAYIPLFFPEDTGKGDGGRKVCTLGYQFLVRDGLLHIWYPLRSCDFVRHWPDDCYMAVRLLLWVLDRCREKNPAVWSAIAPGTYSMHMTSLHVFANDWIKLKQGEKALGT